MASGPITSWQIGGETVKIVTDFIFLGSTITVDDDCSHEIKRRLLLGRKVMTNLDSIFKSRDITLSTKVCLIKVMVFPVVMYGYESWTIKKAEQRRIDAFELWCWRRLLRISACKVTKVKSKLLSSVQLFATPWTVARRAPLSMEFSRQEYWSSQPFPSPGNLPVPGIKSRSPASQVDSLPSEPPGNHKAKRWSLNNYNRPRLFVTPKSIWEEE